MCTSIVVNKSKPIVGWNLDILDMQHRVSTSENGVFLFMCMGLLLSWEL